jgi:hypothetical protein
MKKVLFLIGCLLVVSGIQAQSFILEEEFREQDITDTHTGTAITGDTIEIAYVDAGYVGNVGLGIAISVFNSSNQAKTIGARKIQFAPLQNDVDHIFCFADQCYGENVFVSPFNKVLNANSSDSGTSGRFIAHYNFNTQTHIPGTELVAYSFYDVNNPSDSAVVWVKYTTPVFTTGIQPANTTIAFTAPYPNPASETVTFERTGNSLTEVRLLITSISGTTLLDTAIPAGEDKIHVNTSEYASGIYCCSFFENGKLSTVEKMCVTH